MEWILGLGALYLFFTIVLPILVLAGIAYLAYRWANRERHHTFASSEPEGRDQEEFHFELEDVHHPDDQPPRR